MANVLFTRTSDPNSKPITDGQLIFDTSGNGKMYLDNGTERLEMGGALTVDATLSKTSTNPVQNKAVAGVMLDTLSDISNVTSKGFLTDALAVKALNSSLSETKQSLEATKIKVKTVTGTTTAGANLDLGLAPSVKVLGALCTTNVYATCTLHLNGAGTSWTVYLHTFDKLDQNQGGKTHTVEVYYIE